MQEIIDPKYTRVSQILSIFQSYAHVPHSKLKKAQDTGTEIHGAIEAYFRDEFEPIQAKNCPYFESFLQWADILHPNPIRVEERLYDDKLLITGKIDLLAGIDDAYYLIDFKTGSWAHPKIWELQLTFYRHLLGLYLLPKLPNKFMVVHLKAEGTAPDLYESKYDHKNLEVCMAALKCYRHFEEGVDINPGKVS